MTKTKAIRK